MLDASRILGIAGTDEILVSAVTDGLAGDAEIDFEDRGAAAHPASVVPA